MRIWNWVGPWRPWNCPALEGHAAPITLADLDRVIRSVEPAARLVLPRLLRRVVRQDAGLTGFGFRVPHGKSYVIAREPLLEIADRDELGFGPDEPLPDSVILLERPGADDLAAATSDETLVAYWRLLFHARVHRAFQQRIARGAMEPGEIGRRIGQIGAVEFDEIRSVLQHERFLLPPYDDRSVYVEFAAVYLELRYFAPALLPSYFPTIESWDAPKRLVAEDVDGDELFLSTWLPGAPCPAEPSGSSSPGEAGHRADPATAIAHRATGVPGPLGRRRRSSDRLYLRWMARAERSAALGNAAGAAIRRARAESWAPRERAAMAAAALRNDIARLVARLQAVQDAPEPDLLPWRESLLALAHQTPRGLWTVEARLLYDLQKVCVDHERGIYKVDLWGWIVSLGRRPIKRPLPNQRDVLMSKHLRSAERRLTAARIADHHRRQLAALLHAMTERTESRLREYFGPRIARTLDEVDLRPRNLCERVAKNKLVQELLDRIVLRGFLTLGDLRDAISRNNLKEPDCAGPQGFLRGNALLRADRRLAVALDGVYDRGEIYLRWIQRFSLAAFGTRTGRFLTQYLAIPFGGAYVVLVAVDHFVELLTHRDLDLAPRFREPSTYLPNLALGLFLLGLFHVPRFRRWLWASLKQIARTARFVLVEPVRRLLDMPWIQRVLHSRWSRLAFRFFLKPLAPTLMLWWVFPPESNGWQTAGLVASLFLGVNLALNSRLGRNAEEMLVDWIVEGWHRFGLRFLTGLFWFFVDLFRRLLEAIERLLYSVDEWLRFKSGENRWTFAAKAVLGIAWSAVAYVIRFCVNLLIEPQVNPIKHVPVVTVSHKCIAPMSGMIYDAFLAHGLTKRTATMVTAIIITGTPGIFGFLVWELKENWRLYAANRPARLAAALVGLHGETVPRLFKPGLHSGTIPKRFAKLRRAERHASIGGDPKAARKHREALGQVELAVRRYVEREFIEILADSSGWQAQRPSVGRIHVATNRIKIAIDLPGIAAAPAWIAFELAGGWILAGISDLPPVAKLSAAARHALRSALIGLYKTAGAELVRQQIDAMLPPSPDARRELTPDGLTVWTDGPARVFYDLHAGPVIVPQILDGFPRREMPELDRVRLVFGDMPVTWEQWIAAWYRDLAGGTRAMPVPNDDFWSDVPAIL